MANEYRNMIISFLIVGVFMTLIITMVYQLGTNYGVSSDRLDPVTKGAFDMDDYEDELNTSDSDASNFRESFESGSVDDVDDPSGIFSIAGDVIGVVTTPFKILAEIGSEILHIPTIFIKVILAIINITLLAGLWSLIRRGD